MQSAVEIIMSVPKTLLGENKMSYPTSDNIPTDERTLPNPFRDFCKVHGEFVEDYESGICYFADGSRVTGRNSLGLTGWVDPPTDPYQLLLV